jgi:hypothetical protein
MARVAAGGNRGHFPPWKRFERSKERMGRKYFLHSRCPWAGMERGGGRNPSAATLCHHQAVKTVSEERETLRSRNPTNRSKFSESKASPEFEAQPKACVCEGVGVRKIIPSRILQGFRAKKMKNLHPPK